MQEDLRELVDVESGPTINLKEVVLYGVARSRLWVGLVTLLGVIGGLIAAASQPNEYTSRGALRLAVGKREMLTSENTSGLEDDLKAWPVMADELLLLSDPVLYETAAAEIGPRRILQPADPEQFDGADTPSPVRLLHKIQSFLFRYRAGDHSHAGHECEECLIAAGKALSDNTDLYVDRGSAVISVSHTSMSPEQAHRSTRVLLDAFVDRHRSEYATLKYVEQNNEKLLDAYQHFERSEQAYSEHVEQCGFVDLEAQKGTLVDEIGKLESEIHRKQATRDEVFARRKGLEELLATLPKELVTVTPAVMGRNSDIDRLKDQKFLLLLEKLKLNDPKLTYAEKKGLEEAYKERITQIDELIGNAPDFVEAQPEFTQVVQNPDYSSTQTKITGLVAEDKALGEGIKRLEGYLEFEKEQLDRARQCDRTHTFLNIEIGKSKRMYDQRVEKGSELEILASLDSEGESNLSIFQPAMKPRGKDGPQRMKTLLIGLLGGLFVGVAFAVLRQIFDRRYRYPETLERDLAIKVLAVVPETRSIRKLAGRVGAA